MFPDVAGLSLATGVHVHNLAHLGVALVLVTLSVVGVGLTTLLRQTRPEVRAVTAAASGGGPAG